MPPKNAISVAVLDIGTSNVRASAVDSDGVISAEYRTRFTTVSPTRGFVEFDAEELFQTCLSLLKKLLSEKDCSALAITNQRASTVVFDPASQEPVAMGQSWQDLRTAPMCLVFKGSGISLSPNQSASKIALMMDLFDKERNRSLFGGTIDAWITFRLTGMFKTDHTNVAMTGLVEPSATSYDPEVLTLLKITTENLPSINPSIGYFGDATIGAKTLPLLAILGDQQASMLGQGITRPGKAKATFGTGAMVNILTGDLGPSSTQRLPHGTYPIVARSYEDGLQFGLEAIGLHAGSAVMFACDNLGLATSPAELEKLSAGSREAAPEIFVPALTGLATPFWDFGALACFSDLTFATTRSDLANAVFKGIAHQGTDLIEAIEADAGRTLEILRLDGGMTRNQSFVQMLSNFSGKKLAISPGNEATTIGAGLAAHLALGSIADFDQLESLTESATTVEPSSSYSTSHRSLARNAWKNTLEISRNSVPELSSITF